VSREVRRVPLGWKHPTTYNEHWHVQESSRIRRGVPESKLHGPQERFVGLFEDYPGRLADWERAFEALRNRTGHEWEFGVEYHLTGFQGREDDAPAIHPFYKYADDGETEIRIDVRDEDHLHELLLAEKETEKPDPSDYMPVWDVPEHKLGWCLYETVSEGTPVTPSFATAEELIDHLATVGQDWDQQPMRRSAAAHLVRSGQSLGSMVAVGGVLYKSDEDADVLAEKLADSRGES
jgi:hypothetical protein